MKFYEITDSDDKWVQPFEENPFRLHMRRVSEAETNRIFDREKIYPGNPKNSMTKLSRVSDALMLASVTEWEHPEAVGLKDKAGNPAPCDDENKMRLDKIRVEYEKDGEPVTETIYAIAVRKFNEGSGEEAKN